MDDFIFWIKAWFYLHFTKKGRLENKLYAITMLRYPEFIRREGYAPTLIEEATFQYKRYYKNRGANSK